MVECLKLPRDNRNDGTLFYICPPTKSDDFFVLQKKKKNGTINHFFNLIKYLFSPSYITLIYTVCNKKNFLFDKRIKLVKNNYIYLFLFYKNAVDST